MPTSLNLRFDASERRDVDSSEIPGENLMQSLRAKITDDCTKTLEMDVWRDGGWFFHVEKEGAKLSVVLVPLGDGWLLQIAPRWKPGLIGRLLGGKTSALHRDVYELACQVHTALKANPGFENPKWCWDGFPGDDAGSEVPET
ncbi:hypothetical protein [Lacunimicrobium album]